MNLRAIAILAVLPFLLAAQNARAQCPDWHPGPMDNGSAPNGASGIVVATATK